jgi:hypothetical protein
VVAVFHPVIAVFFPPPGPTSTGADTDDLCLYQRRRRRVTPLPPSPPIGPCSTRSSLVSSICFGSSTRSVLAALLDLFWWLPLGSALRCIRLGSASSALVRLGSEGSVESAPLVGSVSVKKTPFVFSTATSVLSLLVPEQSCKFFFCYRCFSSALLPVARRCCSCVVVIVMGSSSTSSDPLLVLRCLMLFDDTNYHD